MEEATATIEAIAWRRRAEEEIKAGRMAQVATACPECHGYQLLVTWDGKVITPSWNDRQLKRCQCAVNWVYASKLTDSLGLPEDILGRQFDAEAVEMRD